MRPSNTQALLGVGTAPSARHDRSTPSCTGEPGFTSAQRPLQRALRPATSLATRRAPCGPARDARPVYPPTRGAGTTQPAPETSPGPPHPESRPRASGLWQFSFPAPRSASPAEGRDAARSRTRAGRGCQARKERAAGPAGKRPEPRPSSLGPNTASPAPESRWSRPGSRVRLDPSLPSPGPLLQYGGLRVSGLRFRPAGRRKARRAEKPSPFDASRLGSRLTASGHRRGGGLKTQKAPRRGGGERKTRERERGSLAAHFRRK